MLELFNLDLCGLQFCSRLLILLALPAAILQSGLAKLFKFLCPASHLLIAHIVLECHLAVVLPAFQTRLDDLHAFFLPRAPCFSHVASASRSLSGVEVSMSIIHLDPVLELYSCSNLVFLANCCQTPFPGKIVLYGFHL